MGAVGTAAGAETAGRWPRLIGDKAYGSDRLDQHLLETYGIELIAPHLRLGSCPRKTAAHCAVTVAAGGIERLFAWLPWFRRLVTRWEYHIENFFGMVRLGCIKLLLRHI